MHTLTTTATQVMEYLLLVNPDADTHKRVMQEKEIFYMDYKERIAIKTQPHITVANFLAAEAMEETLMKWMHRVISPKNNFRVSLNNFGGFPSSKTIYLRVQNPEPFKKLATELKILNDYLKPYKLPAGRFITTPHLTIARCLPQNIFEHAARQYAQKEFYAEFNATELVLLKRSNKFDACKKVAVFRFKN